jgi:hypothetical protein
MNMVRYALIGLTLLGSAMALSACAAYDDNGYSSLSVGVDSGPYYYHRHHWPYRHYYYDYY